MLARPGIFGIGTSIPQRSKTQGQALEHARSMYREVSTGKDPYKTLYRLSHVEKRHSVLLGTDAAPLELEDFYPADPDSCPSTGQRMRRYEQEAPKLAVPAAKKALEVSEFSDEEISHLVTISCTGFSAPGLDIQLMKELKLKPTVERTHIGFMGCHAAINGIRTAASIIKGDAAARVLMCCVELCSLHFSYKNRTDHIVSNSLFADGAAALVAGPAENMGHGAWQCLSTASFLLPESDELMSWTITDSGFVMGLSPLVAKALEQTLEPWLSEWLGNHSLSLKDIKSWAVHPGGPRILSAVEAALDLSKEDLDFSRNVLRQYGNMSSCTVLFVLEEITKADLKGPCILLAFGPGVVCEVALLMR